MVSVCDSSGSAVDVCREEPEGNKLAPEVKPVGAAVVVDCCCCPPLRDRNVDVKAAAPASIRIFWSSCSVFMPADIPGLAGAYEGSASSFSSSSCDDAPDSSALSSDERIPSSSS